MINIKTKESQLELDIGFYDHYFHADELSCIDQPIAVCADLFFKSAYFFIVYTLSGQKIGIIR